MARRRTGIESSAGSSPITSWPQRRRAVPAAPSRHVDLGQIVLGEQLRGRVAGSQWRTHASTMVAAAPPGVSTGTHSRTYSERRYPSIWPLAVSTYTAGLSGSATRRSALLAVEPSGIGYWRTGCPSE